MQEKLHDLMSAYITGNLTESEQHELTDYLELNPSDHKILEDYRLLWEESDLKIDIKSIDVEKALRQTKLRLSFNKSNILLLLQKAAAIFILAGFLSMTYLYFHKSASITNLNQDQVITQEISTIFGNRSKFQLPDGTTVCLNSGSKLIFPSEFKGKTRKVELIGEAFFEVTPNTAKPFIVKTADIDIKVLGTAFNIQAYPKAKEISTTLVHGKVVLERGFKGVMNQIADLKPSDRAVFKLNDKVITISKEEDLDKFIAWKDGKLVFFNDPIEEVANKLGNWYNVTVTINNLSIKRYRFTATFTDEPIEKVLELLSKSSPIKYQSKKEVRLSDNSYSKREIILN